MIKSFCRTRSDIHVNSIFDVFSQSALAQVWVLESASIVGPIEFSEKQFFHLGEVNSSEMEGFCHRHETGMSGGLKESRDVEKQFLK